ncbi:MAG: leucine-rich repeat protein [Oscillospiraceae bacterium]|nr:leucine-rich repeat protein [Oscillospiraceae bacterium]
MFNARKWIRLLSVCFLLSLLITGAITAQAATVPAGLEYTVENGEVTITKYTGSAVSLTIPSYIDGCPVRTIGASAFNWNDDLYTITLPSTLKTIERYAFNGCSYITKLVIPNSVTVIEAYAFQNCSNLASVTLGSGLKSIGDCAFYGCEFLASVVIPNSVTTVGESAFRDCSSLASVKLSSAMTSVSAYAFSGCANLSKITWGSKIQSIGNYAFEGCGSLTSVTLPNSVKTIGNVAFSYCKSLKSFDTGSGVTSIGSSTFADCEKLESITLGNKLKTIDQFAFSDCEALKKIVLPNTVTSIGDCCFYRCYALNSITLSNKLKSIGDTCFYYTALKSITIPDSVTELGESAFAGCKLTSVQLGNGISAIPASCFSGCPNLTSVVIPKSVSVVDTDAFCKCPSLKYIYFPDSVTVIGKEAFFSCDGLENVRIGNGVITVGELAFGYCDNLKTVTLGNSVITVGKSAFASCPKLTTVTMGPSVVAVNGSAFSGCSSLKYVKHSGSSANRSAMRIDSGNTALENAAWSYPTPVKISKQPVNVTVRSGATAKVTCTAKGTGLTYQWYYTNNASDTTFSKASVTTASYSFTMNASYSGRKVFCVVTDKNGFTVQSKTVTMSMAASAKITAQPSNKYVPVGTTAKFTVKATGTGLKYQWQYRTSSTGSWKAASATGNKTATLSVAATTSRNNYQYRCKITDSTGSTVYSNAVTLKLVTLKITAQPVNRNMPDGKTAVFAVKASGTGLQYQWQYRTSSTGSWKSAAATGNKTASMSVPVTASRSGYQYRCKITDKYSNVIYSQAVTLKLVTLKVTAQPANQSVTEGLTAKFTVKATGTGLKYQWQYRTSSTGSWKAASATGNKTATLSVPATASRSGYQYRCKITDQYANAIYSGAAKLTVTVQTQPSQPSQPTQPSQPVQPVPGVPYKMYMNNGSMLYFNGQTESATVNYRLATTTNEAEAVDVYLEQASGGYRLYFYNGSTKTYIRVYAYFRSGEAYPRGTLELTTTAPAEVFTYSSDANTLIYQYDQDNSFYMGTYSSHTDISAQSTYYITGDKADSVDKTQFPVHLCPA